MRGMILVISTLLSVLIVACNENTPKSSPRVQLTLPPIATSTPRPTQIPATASPLPTTVSWWPTAIPEATQRAVSVSRINDTVDPTQNLLLKEGEPVPPIVLTDIDGNRYQLDQLQGKVVIINFWTVGCGSCFFEFPLLQAVYEKFGDDILILAVNVSDLAEETRTLATNLGVSYPMFVDPEGAIFIRYFGGAVVPTTYIIRPDGTVYNAYVGPIDRTLLDAILTELGIQESS
ncbi:MAG: hypothetical protein CUN55_01905 [Phototrophicales bacterium]|nr:MAG: hypothetical protein CUN55_01905 [Phototrophicales bacterium]